MFFLGSHRASWLGLSTTPLMVSRATIADRKSPLPRTLAPWYLDSAAFTELEAHGKWAITAAEWAKLARRWADEAGQLAAVAIQDWICTPPTLARTGLTVAEHQARTIRSLLELRDLDADLPWVPTLQGWAPNDYLAHADAYLAAGVQLDTEPMVGLGSIATRQHTTSALAAITRVHRAGLGNLHAYGAKVSGLKLWGWAVASADSMAWSFRARMGAVKLDGCTHRGPCSNCLRWAELWATDVAPLIGSAGIDQPELFTTH